MIKTLNYYAIAAALLAIPFGGLQNCATAQDGLSSPGDFDRGVSGQGIELVPSWDFDDVENSQQSFYQQPNMLEGYGNGRLNGPLPPSPNPNGQRNFSSEANRFQGPPNRAEFQQSNRPERGSHRRGRHRHMNFQAGFPNAAQQIERSRGENWNDGGGRYGAYRQDFAETDSQLAQFESQRHRGGCRGGCGARHRGGDFDATSGSGTRLRPTENQFDQPLPNQFPNNEADQQPSLRIPYSQFNDI